MVRSADAGVEGAPTGSGRWRGNRNRDHLVAADPRAPGVGRSIGHESQSAAEGDLIAGRRRAGSWPAVGPPRDDDPVRSQVDAWPASADAALGCVTSFTHEVLRAQVGDRPAPAGVDDPRTASPVGRVVEPERVSREMGRRHDRLRRTGRRRRRAAQARADRTTRARQEGCAPPSTVERSIHAGQRAGRRRAVCV
jgi:hypothetical protein